MAGPQDVNLMKSFTDKLAMAFSVYNVVAIGKLSISPIVYCHLVLRSGAKCEKCSDGFYLDSRRDQLGRQSCIPCNCNGEGSSSDQCSDTGILTIDTMAMLMISPNCRAM